MTSSRRLGLLVAALACVGPGTWTVAHTQPVSTLAPQQPSAAPAWRATLRFSGGLLGLDREVTLASTGDLKVSDRSRQSEATKKASARELAQVASLVADLKPFVAPRDLMCMDCPQYDLSVQANGRSVVASLNYITLAGTSVEQLVKALAAILDRELSEQPGPQTAGPQRE